MKFRIIAVITLATTIGMAIPVSAQFRDPARSQNRSLDFFDQGRDQLEREIQIIQEESLNVQQNLQKPQSDPLLEVSPSVTNAPSQKPSQIETPNQSPNTVITPNPQLKQGPVTDEQYVPQK